MSENTMKNFVLGKKIQKRKAIAKGIKIQPLH